jgi:hypothetical protein
MIQEYHARGAEEQCKGMRKPIRGYSERKGGEFIRTNRKSWNLHK